MMKKHSMARGKEKIVISNNDDEKEIESLFRELHDMLPHVPRPADKVTVVDETINYIRSLKKTVKELEKKKLERQLLLQSSLVTKNVGTSSSTDAMIAEPLASSPTSEKSKEKKNTQ